MGAIRFLSTCFIWFPCGLPIWVPDPAHSFHRSCPQFRPYGPHTVFVHLLHMGPMWVANMQYGFHLGCQYESQILPTFAQDLDHFSAFKRPPVSWGSHVGCSIGSLILATWIVARPLVSRTEMWWRIVFSRKKSHFWWRWKLIIDFKCFLENINVSFIKTVIYSLYDVKKYVLCKGLNIHLYLSYILIKNTQTNF